MYQASVENGFEAGTVHEAPTCSPAWYSGLPTTISGPRDGKSKQQKNGIYSGVGSLKLRILLASTFESNKHEIHQLCRIQLPISPNKLVVKVFD